MGRLLSHHLVIYPLLVLLINLLILPLLSLVAFHIQDYFKKNRGGGGYIKTQQENSRREDRRKQIRVTVRSKLIVGFGVLIPMESGYDKSS